MFFSPTVLAPKKSKKKRKIKKKKKKRTWETVFLCHHGDSFNTFKIGVKTTPPISTIV